MGYNETILIPVCEGVPVLRLWQAMPLAGQAVENKIKTCIDVGQPLPDETLDNIVEDIKGKTSKIFYILRICNIYNLILILKIILKILTISVLLQTSTIPIFIRGLQQYIF